MLVDGCPHAVDDLLYLFAQPLYHFVLFLCGFEYFDRNEINIFLWCVRYFGWSSPLMMPVSRHNLALHLRIDMEMMVSERKPFETKGQSDFRPRY